MVLGRCILMTSACGVLNICGGPFRGRTQQRRTGVTMDDLRLLRAPGVMGYPAEERYDWSKP